MINMTIQKLNMQIQIPKCVLYAIRKIKKAMNMANFGRHPMPIFVDKVAQNALEVQWKNV